MQLKENNQLNAGHEIAGPVSEIPLENDQILKGGGFWDDVNGGYLPEDLVLAARREEMPRCKNAEMQARNCWSRPGWTQTSL